MNRLFGGAFAALHQTLTQLYELDGQIIAYKVRKEIPMNHTHPQFHAQNGSETIDLEQVDQFQPEVAPRSTSTAINDLYTSSQIESSRYHEQGDPNEYSTRFEDQ